MPRTYHLHPADAWSALGPNDPIVTPSLVDEGFIHCTTGADEMVTTANRHYREDERSFVVLTIELDDAGSPWRIEDARGIYPHVFGPIDRRAVLGVQPMPRAADGTFLAFASASAEGDR